MVDIFYRLHREEAPAFCAENAYSAAWGQAFSADGRRYECPVCDGSGESCWNCNGEGWFECEYGYSCCTEAAELLEYFDRHCPPDDSDPVVVFEGVRVGSGLDGEPLAVPERIIEWTTIGVLRQRNTAKA